MTAVAVAVAQLEERFIAGLLVEPAATLGEVRPVLDPALLHSRQARAIYEALIAVVDRGDTPGISGLWAEVTSSGADPLFPRGIAILEGFADILSAPLPAETVQLARTLADLARQRRAQTAATAFGKDPSAERRAVLAEALREQAVAEEAVPLAVMTWADLVRDTIPEVPWQIEGILPERGLGSLTADTGVGKSWALADLALSVATGEPVWGHFAVHRPGPVLYLDEENGPAELSRRFSKLAHGRGLMGADLPVFALSCAGLKVDDPDGLDALLRLVREHRPVLVILDSLIRFHSQDENSNSGMARVTAALRRLTQEGPAVLPAHHPRKLGGIGVSNAAIERGRGAKESIAGLDTYLFARLLADGAIGVETAKLRHGIPRPPFTLKIEDTPAGATCVTYGDEMDNEGDKLDQARLAMILAVQDAGGILDRKTVFDLVTGQGHSGRTAKRALADLRQTGVFVDAGFKDARKLLKLDSSKLVADP